MHYSVLDWQHTNRLFIYNSNKNNTNNNEYYIVTDHYIHVALTCTPSESSVAGAILTVRLLFSSLASMESREEHRYKNT